MNSDFPDCLVFVDRVGINREGKGLKSRKVISMVYLHDLCESTSIELGIKATNRQVN